MLLLPLTSALPTALQRTERRSVASALLIQIALQRTERRSATSALLIHIASQRTERRSAASTAFIQMRISAQSAALPLQRLLNP